MERHRDAASHLTWRKKNAATMGRRMRRARIEEVRNAQKDTKGALVVSRVRSKALADYSGGLTSPMRVRLRVTWTEVDGGEGWGELHCGIAVDGSDGAVGGGDDARVEELPRFRLSMWCDGRACVC